MKAKQEMVAPDMKTAIISRSVAMPGDFPPNIRLKNVHATSERDDIADNVIHVYRKRSPPAMLVRVAKNMLDIFTLQ